MCVCVCVRAVSQICDRVYIHRERYLRFHGGSRHCAGQSNERQPPAVCGEDGLSGTSSGVRNALHVARNNMVGGGQNEFMHYRGLPHNLRKRIRAFYHSFWNRGIYFNENAILGDLTFDLQKDVARFLNQVCVECLGTLEFEHAPVTALPCPGCHPQRAILHRHG